MLDKRIFDYEDLEKPIDPDNKSPLDLTKKIYQESKQLLCEWYAYNPLKFVPTPSNKLLRSFYNNLCGDTPSLPPPPTTPPYDGGQCPVLYDVFIQMTGKRSEDGPQVTMNKVAPTRTVGPMSGGFFAKLPAFALAYVEWTNGDNQIVRSTHQGGWQIGGEGAILGWPNFDWVTAGSILRVVRVDGQPDDCGSLDEEFLPPSGDPPPTTKPVFGPDENNDFNLDFDITFQPPDVDVFLPPIIKLPGLEIQFDIGGPSFNPAPPSDNPNDPPPIEGPPLLPPLPDSGPCDLNVDVQTSIENIETTLTNDISVSIESIETTINDIQQENQNCCSETHDQLDDLIDDVADLPNQVANPDPTTSITVPSGICADGVWTESTLDMAVPASLADTALELFTRMYKIEKENCGKEENLVIGVPMPYYEGTTSECATLYFSYRVPNGSTIGRYISIPKPNQALLIQEAYNIPDYQTGRWLCYVQYGSFRGNKIQIYGKDANTATAFRGYLEQFTTYSESDIYARFSPREVTPRHEWVLQLKRITYFPQRRGKYSGQDAGTKIWERQ